MPVRTLLQRFSLLILFLTAFLIMLLGKAEMAVVERVRTGVVDIVAPVMDAASRPIATVTEGIDRIGNLFTVYEDNERLREQNARLLEWQNAAFALAAENSTFRKMLNYTPEPGARFASARVIGNSGGVFVRSVLVNAGAQAGVEKGDAVISGSGLVGRVAETGWQSGRVLLITDLNSRIPVIVEKTRIRAILAGDNSWQPKLAFLPPNARLDVGDRIVTSGHAGVFPAGLPVGRIASVSGGVMRIEAFANFDRLEYVRILTSFPGEKAGHIVPSTVHRRAR